MLEGIKYYVIVNLCIQLSNVKNLLIHLSEAP